MKGPYWLVWLGRLEQVLTYSRRTIHLPSQEKQLFPRESNRSSLVTDLPPDPDSKVLLGICVISMDMYNDGSKVIDSNFDDPRITDYDLLLSNIRDLKEGKDIQVRYEIQTEWLTIWFGRCRSTISSRARGWGTARSKCLNLES